MAPAVQFVPFVPIGSALAVAHAVGLAFNARLYGVPGAAARAIVVHVLRSVLLVIAFVVLALRGASELGMAALAFAGTHGPMVALLARQP